MRKTLAVIFILFIFVLSGCVRLPTPDPSTFCSAAAESVKVCMLDSNTVFVVTKVRDPQLPDASYIDVFDTTGNNLGSCGGYPTDKGIASYCKYTDCQSPLDC